MVKNGILHSNAHVFAKPLLKIAVPHTVPVLYDQVYLFVSQGKIQINQVFYGLAIDRNNRVAGFQSFFLRPASFLHTGYDRM